MSLFPEEYNTDTYFWDTFNSIRSKIHFSQVISLDSVHCLNNKYVPKAEVPKLWGAIGSLGGREFVWWTFILNEIWAQDKIYIFW
jgi:hypothetical protein